MYSWKSPGANNPMVWKIKDEVLNYAKFPNFIKPEETLVAGKTVFLKDKPYKYSLKIIKEFLATKNCTLTKNQSIADVIVVRGDMGIGVYDNLVYKPTEIDSYLLNIHKCLHVDTVSTSISNSLDNQRVKIDFDESIYENIWLLLKDGSSVNVNLAAMTIMTIDWKAVDKMFLLHILTMHFAPAVRSSNLSQIPGWSGFTNRMNISWKSHYYYATKIIQLLKMYEVTESEIKLVHKLLNT